jgi:hypothetical protein
MKIPLIFITYGFTNKICSFEENGVHKIPVFEDPDLAAKFAEEFRKIITYNRLHRDVEEPCPQICDNKQHVLDILTLICVKEQNPIVSLNIGGDDHTEYEIDQAIEIIQNHN